MTLVRVIQKCSSAITQIYVVDRFCFFLTIFTFSLKNVQIKQKILLNWLHNQKLALSTYILVYNIIARPANIGQ